MGRFAVLVLFKVVGAGELEGDEDAVIDLAVVMIKELAAQSRDGQRMNLAQEDAAGVKLMAAQLGHQAAAGSLVKAPADQLFQVLVAELPDSASQGIAVLPWDLLAPAVPEHRLAMLVHFLPAVVVEPGPTIIPMPESADVLDVAELTRVDDLDGMGVEQAVVALVPDREDTVGLVGHADHVLALADIPGHQLLAQDVLAGTQGLDRHRGVQVQGQGDDDRFEVLVFE